MIAELNEFSRADERAAELARRLRSRRRRGRAQGGGRVGGACPGLNGAFAASRRSGVPADIHLAGHGASLIELQAEIVTTH